MYDSIHPEVIPHDAQAVAGYVGGKWPTFTTLEKQFPNAHKLSIAVVANEDADCLDIEAGDAVPAEAASWVKRQHKLGKKTPVVYTSTSVAQILVNTLAKAGLQHGRDYKLWTAHYNFKRHRCTHRCGYGLTIKADATQYSDHALNLNLDESVCGAHFF